MQLPFFCTLWHCMFEVPGCVPPPAVWPSLITWPWGRLYWNVPFGQVVWAQCAAPPRTCAPKQGRSSDRAPKTVPRGKALPNGGKRG